MVEFTQEEIEELKTNISQIKGRIPEHLAGWVWGTYNRINGSNEKQPCGCKSAAGLWGKAYNTILDYVKGLDNDR